MVPESTPEAAAGRAALGPPHDDPPAMKRLLQAPNLALATLWADQLSAAGFAARVMRAYASGIAGEIPPDQALPEVWLDDDSRHDEARSLFERWMHPPERRWACAGCGEVIEGPFEQCWNCGAAAPEAGPLAG